MGGGEVHAVASSSNAASSEPAVHAETPVLRSQNNVHVGRKRPRALLEGGSMLTSRGSLNNKKKVGGSGTKSNITAKLHPGIKLYLEEYFKAKEQNNS